MSATAIDLSVEILDGAACVGLRDQWETLLQRSYDTRIFLTPTWFQIWLKHFTETTPYVVVGRDPGGELAAILPLQVLQHDGRRVLSGLGDHNVSDYMDGIADKVEAENSLTELLRAALPFITFDALELRHVPSGSPLISAIRTVGADLGLAIQVEDDEICPVAILCNTWNGYLQMLSKKQRHEIRRKMRRTFEGAAWSWRTSETRSDVERDLEPFFRLHTLSGGEKSRFMTDRMHDYFHDLALAMHERNVLRLSVLQREGHDIAALMGFSFRGRYMLYNSSYDAGHAMYSPGISAVSLMMQDAIREGAIAFDFLSGNEPYKYQFGASDTRTSRVFTTG